MLAFANPISSTQRLEARLACAETVTAKLMNDTIARVCNRLAALPSNHGARFRALVANEAWVEAALMLIAVELPQWSLRRATFDDGEWHCTLSSDTRLPNWLDDSVDAHGATLALAILRAFVAAHCSMHSDKGDTAVPVAPCPVPANSLEAACCDNFS